MACVSQESGLNFMPDFLILNNGDTLTDVPHLTVFSTDT